MLIGAPLDDTGADCGAAYLFSTNGTLLTTFTNPTPAAVTFSAPRWRRWGATGCSLARTGRHGRDGCRGGVSVQHQRHVADHLHQSHPGGRRLLRLLGGGGGERPGAHWRARDDTGAANAGAAYLFSTNGTLLHHLHQSHAGGRFRTISAASVAAVGSDRVLIGAHLTTRARADAGAAYLFSTNGTLLTTFTNPTPAATDSFGYSVAAVGSDRVLIGAPADTPARWVPGRRICSASRASPRDWSPTRCEPGSVTTASLEDWRGHHRQAGPRDRRLDPLR